MSAGRPASHRVHRLATDPPRSRSRRQAWLLVCLLAAAAPARAERLALRLYTTADGLAHESLRCVVPDSRGFVWFCTDEGLSRFDGSSFVTYGIDQGLPSGLIYDFLETRDGHYWIATSAGLVRFDPQGTSAQTMFVTHAKRADGLPHRVTTLLHDRDDMLWVGTLDGLYRMKAKGTGFELLPVDLGPPIASGQILDLLQDRHGAVWIATMAGLYRRPARGTCELVPLAGTPGTPSVNALLEDREGHVWVGTRTVGLFQFDIAASSRPVLRHVYTPPANGLPSEWINTVVQTSDGTLWVGTSGGLVQLRPARGQAPHHVRRYAAPHGVVDREVLSIAEDRQGALWFGTAFTGAAKLAHREITIFDRGDGLSWASSLANARSGELVVLGGPTPDGESWSLTGFDGTRSLTVSLRLPVLPGWGWNQTLLQDHAGDWWIGTDDGVFRFSGVRTFADLARAAPSARLTTRHGLGRTVLRLFEDSHGDVWIGSAGGSPYRHVLSRWERKTGTLRHYSEADGLPDSRFFVSALGQDRAGQVWVGYNGAGGLARRQGERFVRYTAADGVPAGMIANFLLDTRGRLWAASDRAGLCRIDVTGPASTPRFTTFTTAQGLSSNAMRAITEDRAGGIYIGHGRGIDRFDPESGRVQRYPSADGVPTGARAALRDRHGALWFTTRSGVLRLVPEDDPPLVAPPLLITGLRVGAKPVPISAIGERNPRPLALQPGDSHLHIEFVALGVGPGDGTRYQYQLEGADTTWSAPTTQRGVTYANLAPGAYCFRVRAVNGADVLDTTPASIVFTVLPPIWWRWWFMLLVAAAIAAVVHALYRVRMRRLLELVHMRTGIATDLHDDIGANLTRIAILSEVARQHSTQAHDDAANGSGSQLDQPLASIARIARESVSGMSDIVWAISPDRDSLVELARKMREHVEEVFAARNLAVTFTPVGLRKPVRLDGTRRRDVYLIFKEAVNNAARHSGCSRIAVDVRIDSSTLWLTVTDDGVGFEAGRTHDGHGLSSMRRRAERLGGTLRIDSRPGDGTTIALTVALARRRRWPWSNGRAPVAPSYLDG